MRRSVAVPPLLGTDVSAVELIRPERPIVENGVQSGQTIEYTGTRWRDGLDRHGQRLGEVRHGLRSGAIRRFDGMYTFIELWTPNDNWLALKADERAAFMEGVGGAMGQMAEAGIETLGWGAVDPDTPVPAAQQYVAVWQAPDKAAIEMLEQGIEASGWYSYFDQVNARAELSGPEVVIGEHVAM